MHRKEAFNEEERQELESVNIRKIRFAARAGGSHSITKHDIPIKTLEQDKQTDCKFLYSVLRKYGLAMKVFGENTIIFHEARYESAAPVFTLQMRIVSGTNTPWQALTPQKYDIPIREAASGHHASWTGSRIKEMNVEARAAGGKAVAANNANKKRR